MPRPASLAVVALSRNDGAALAPLIAEFLDEFYTDLADGRDHAPAMLMDEPPALCERHEHALLGAIGEHLARRWQLPAPDWTNDPSRFLKRPYFTSPIAGLKALMIAENPLAFRRRLIFTEAEPLRRASMPRPQSYNAPATPAPL